AGFFQCRDETFHRLAGLDLHAFGRNVDLDRGGRIHVLDDGGHTARAAAAGHAVDMQFHRGSPWKGARMELAMVARSSGAKCLTLPSWEASRCARQQAGGDEPMMSTVDPGTPRPAQQTE